MFAATDKLYLVN